MFYSEILSIFYMPNPNFKGHFSKYGFVGVGALPVQCEGAISNRKGFPLKGKGPLIPLKQSLMSKTLSEP